MARPKRSQGGPIAAQHPHPGARLLFRGNLEGALRLTDAEVKIGGSPGALPDVLAGLEDEPQEVVLAGRGWPGPRRRLS